MTAAHLYDTMSVEVEMAAFKWVPEKGKFVSEFEFTPLADATRKGIKVAWILATGQFQIRRRVEREGK